MIVSVLRRFRLFLAMAPAALLLILLIPGPVLSRSRQQDDTVTAETKLLAAELSGIAALRPSGDGVTWRQPLAVFYEPGDGPSLRLDENVGVLTSGRHAVPVRAISCPPGQVNSSVAAVCLEPQGLNGVGTYKGTVQLFPDEPQSAAEDEGRAATQDEADEEAQGEADEEAEDAGGQVTVTLIVQRSLLFFSIVAAAGALFSHTGAWFVEDYQKIRKLRKEREKYVDGCNGLPCPEQEDKKRPALRLLNMQSLFEDSAWHELDRFGIVLWFKSFVGKRPDYEALNKSLTRAAEVQTRFTTLCLLYTALDAERKQIDSLYADVGGNGAAQLSTNIAGALALDNGEVHASEVADLLQGWQELEETARRWRNQTTHLATLCAWRLASTGERCATVAHTGNIYEHPDAIVEGDGAAEGKEPQTAADGAGQPGHPETEGEAVANAPGVALATDDNGAGVHMAVARGKLGVIAQQSDFEILRPDEDIRAAWLALQKLRAVAPAAKFSATAAMALATLPRLPQFSDRAMALALARAFWRQLEPRLNSLTIVILLLLSFVATVVAGVQTLYWGKPWGTGLDIVFLFLVGTGVHAGLTGLASAIVARQKPES